MQEFLKRIKSKYKDEIILGMAEEPDFETKFLPTDILALDYIIGKPGIPAWRITQIAGFEDTGKTLLALKLLIAFQKYYKKGLPILVDTEVSFDSDFFEKLGGDLKRLVIFTPKTIEECFSLLKEIISEFRKESKSHILIVIDSLSFAVEQELEGKYQPGIHARELSKIFREWRTLLYRINSTLIYVSQNKEKLNIGWGFGGGVARLGGHAVDFAPVLTIETKKIGEVLNDEGDIIGIKFSWKITKNHVSVPFRQIDVIFDYKSYNFLSGTVIRDILIKEEKIQKKAGWYSYEGKNYREKDLIEFLENKVEEIRKKLGLEYGKEETYSE